MKLSLASFLSDRIVDEILEALSTSQLTLVKSKTAYLFFHFDCSQLEPLQLHFFSYTYVVLPLPVLSSGRPSGAARSPPGAAGVRGYGRPRGEGC